MEPTENSAMKIAKIQKEFKEKNLKSINGFGDSLLRELCDTKYFTIESVDEDTLDITNVSSVKKNIKIAIWGNSIVIRLISSYTNPFYIDFHPIYDMGKNINSRMDHLTDENASKIESIYENLKKVDQKILPLLIKSMPEFPFDIDVDKILFDSTEYNKDVILFSYSIPFLFFKNKMEIRIMNSDNNENPYPKIYKIFNLENLSTLEFNYIISRLYDLALREI